MKDKTAITSNITHALDALDFLCRARKEKMMVLYGEPGVGKSQACEFLAQQGALLFECPARPTAYSFCSALLLKLGGSRCRSAAAAQSSLVELLAKHHQVLILDESDRLLWRQREELLEIVRYLHDQTGVPVVLVGMVDLYNQMAPYRQLCDRIHFLEFLPWSREDARLVSETCCEVRIEEDLLKAIHQTSQGNGRLMTRCFEHVERHAQALGFEAIGLPQWGDQPFLPEFSRRPQFRKRGRKAA